MFRIHTVADSILVCCVLRRYRVVPLWALRIVIALLGLLGRPWPKALRYRSFARFLLIVSQYDAVGERCGTRRMVNYMQALAAKQRGDSGSGGGEMEMISVRPAPRGGDKKLQ